MLSVCVEDEDGCDGVERLSRKLDVEAVAVLRYFQRLVGLVGEEVSAGDFAGHLVEMERAVRPMEDFDVDLVRAGGGAPVPCGDELRFAVFVLFGVAEAASFGAEESGFGVVDCFAVDASHWPICWSRSTSGAGTMPFESGPMFSR